MNGKKVYFISDLHLGLPTNPKSLIREKLLVNLLDEIKINAHTIYFVGDVFDFWWEYKYVVPKGFIRFLGKIAELTDAGIKINFFTGNHDVWMKSYLTDEIGVKILHQEISIDIAGKKFFIAHGDGLGPGDTGYKILKKIFTNRFLQWCYSRLHPNFSFQIANSWSKNRRKKEKYIEFKGESELLIQFAKEKLTIEHFDYFIFGHRHFPAIIDLKPNSKYINIGDWLINFTYVEFDGTEIKQYTYKKGISEIYKTDLSVRKNLDIF
jgi:UDP-2,3-diacylglucosamine hydrolase